MLTPKQHDLLMFIKGRLDESGVSPSFEEMKDALGLHSKSGIHRLIKALEERGFIRRLPNRARALEVIKLPLDEQAATPAPKPTPITSHGGNVISANLGRSTPIATAEPANEGGMAIPRHGKIAAGLPVEALEHVDDSITVPTELLGRGNHFALEVSGDSMIDLGIFDGDTAIIEQCNTARNGDIIVALVDDEDATLKTLHQKGDQIALKPANKDYSTQILPAHRVKIQGKLVGLIRQY